MDAVHAGVADVKDLLAANGQREIPESIQEFLSVLQRDVVESLAFDDAFDDAPLFGRTLSDEFV